MTSPIPGPSGSDPLKAAASAAAAKQAEGKSKSIADKDTFMKLLVAQLKYQDPTKPADSAAFMAQTAQFTQVEKLEDMISMLQSQRMIGASSLVGKTVTYMDDTGAMQTGVISAAKLNGDSEPTLKVGNTDVQLSKVTEITQPTA
ncbi:flagellar hook capping FlgD N-terminal domain-containing protein [Actinoplanes sp. NPDC023714]|uniref:flagellar hook assembly protein FlgD n=1 Tax=Actinoplanes sp. NPDC023714 TaxID=3154322 RepID=UPI0033E0FE9E